ncbi:MAG: DNA-processing protein DprA [bacterium]
MSSADSVPPARCFLDRSAPDWPPLWLEMTDPPPRVSVTGECDALARQAIGIVGTRQATPRGLAVATGLAGALVRLGWIVVSGMALGIDAAAHRGAIRAGGKTVAVMGTGSDLTYPAQHVRLRREIESHGCCVTEFPDGTPPYKSNFPRRNRLIAGMAEGVIVVEAPTRSGALLTAYLALDMCREVFAVPGPIDSLQSRGCHHLLREGATLLESPDDLQRVLAPPEYAGSATEKESTRSTLPEPAPGSAARWIWDRLDLGGVEIGELQRRWSGSRQAWSEGLIALEMGDLIRRLPGGRLARKIWRP